MLEEAREPPKRSPAAAAAGCGAAAGACCRCLHRRRASPLTCLAICFLVLSYNLLGGFLFLAVEGGALAEETAVAASMPNLSRAADLRSRTVERLWSITEDLNILYKENWTELAAKELMDFQKVLMKSMRGRGSLESPPHYDAPEYRWTYAGSFLYALTLITTIGHGNVTPTSTAGKMTALLYACVGIPLIMLYLSTIGEALARNFRALYSKLCPERLPSAECERDQYPERPRRTPFQAALNQDALGAGYLWTCRDHTRVPIVLSVLLMASYVALGTVLFRLTEKWSLVDGCYFSFSSLATIGFGDLRPGLHASTVSAKAEDIAVGACCIYILVGIVVVAMCFNLIQEELGAALRGLGALCAGGGRARAVHSAEPREDKPAGGGGGAGGAGGAAAS